MRLLKGQVRYRVYVHTEQDENAAMIADHNDHEGIVWERHEPTEPRA